MAAGGQYLHPGLKRIAFALSDCKGQQKHFRARRALCRLRQIFLPRALDTKKTPKGGAAWAQGIAGMNDSLLTTAS